MQTKHFIVTVFATVLCATSISVSAQTTRTNLDRQPDWGPYGYDLAEFYYIPALDVYYEIEAALFYILQNDVWVAVKTLPERFGDYDLYSCYKVVMNGKEPWRNHSNHTNAYDSYRTKKFRQVTIRANNNPGDKDNGKHNPKREQRQREKAQRENNKQQNQHSDKGQVKQDNTQTDKGQHNSNQQGAVQQNGNKGNQADKGQSKPGNNQTDKGQHNSNQQGAAQQNGNKGGQSNKAQDNNNSKNGSQGNARHDNKR